MIEPAATSARRDGGLVLRILGDVAFVAGRSAARRAIAAAFPELTPRDLARLARQSARLRVRRNFDRSLRIDDVAFCRRLLWVGDEALRLARAASVEPPASSPPRYVTAALGLPAVALRAVRLYCGDPAARLTLLPEPAGRHETAREPTVEVPFLGRSVRCSTAWAHTGDGPVLPVFATLGAGATVRVEMRAPLATAPTSIGDDPSSITYAACAALESAVREHPADWPWAEWGARNGSGRISGDVKK